MEMLRIIPLNDGQEERKRSLSSKYQGVKESYPGQPAQV